jgi:hypothetical protein
MQSVSSGGKISVSILPGVYGRSGSRLYTAGSWPFSTAGCRKDGRRTNIPSGQRALVERIGKMAAVHSKIVIHARLAEYTAILCIMRP